MVHDAGARQKPWPTTLIGKQRQEAGRLLNFFSNLAVPAGSLVYEVPSHLRQQLLVPYPEVRIICPVKVQPSTAIGGFVPTFY